MSKKTAPYGSWPSPISAELLTSANVGLSEPWLDGTNIYWLESRPLERGRSAIVRLAADGKKRDLLPQPLNARSRVNEYGGGSYCVHDGFVYFVLFDDQRIYRLPVAQETTKTPAPEALTPEGARRYGNLTVDANRQRLLAVCEDHSTAGQEAETSLVSIPLQGGMQEHQTLVFGDDFYSSPAVSPDGRQIAWLSWKHPNMPWDACECWLGEFDADGEIVNRKQIAGGDRESVFQPQWSPDGNLYLISDRSNWWNIYRHDGEVLVPVCEKAMEFGTPQWVFGLSTYGFLDDQTILATFTQSGIWHLCTIDLKSGDLQVVESPLTDIGYIQARGDTAVFIGASGDQFPALYRFDAANRRIEQIVNSGDLPVDRETISLAEPVEFPAGDEVGYAFFYPPRNRHYEGEAGSKPPLLVLCHGGPTSATKSVLNLKIQYWTSRGFAVADVNYGGSTGYGRHYRERLKGQWGVVDVQDAVDCVNFLADSGRIDRNKVAIRGSSAGGYTVLAALTFHDVFRAGASLYGIGDLETLAADTHKFESRYLDNLVGPYPAQQTLYRERSPIRHIEQLNCPVIFLQGLKDKVVPPNQAEAMVAALDEKQIPVAYVTFEEEAHGFRQAPNIRRAQEAELYFYSRVFGFTPAGDTEAVPIRHADKLGDPA